MPIEHGGRRVRVRPDLLKIEPVIRDHLTDVQKRDGPDATIVSAELVSDELSFNLDIDNVPGAAQLQGQGLPVHRRHHAMTQRERRRSEGVALLIAVRERNDDEMRALEAERDGLLTRGRLIPADRRRPSRATRPGA